MPDKSDFIYKTHAELLQDDNFLVWKLSPTAQMDKYWMDLQQKYPGLINEISLADAYLKENLFPKRVLKNTNKEQFLKNIYQSNELKKKHNKKKKKMIINCIWCGAAACILILISITLFHTIAKKQPHESIFVSELETKEIQLITGEKTTSFSENVNININEQGVAEIMDDKGKKQETAFGSEKWNKLIVPYGKRSKIELSDGTAVWLNSGSTLEFPTVFEKSTREIQLITGEIYIEVMPNKKKSFQVKAPNFIVQVLGTRFNIAAYEGQAQSIVLVEGSVELKTDKVQEKYELFPNEIAFYTDNDTFSKEKTDALKHISWTKGYIILNKTPLTEVMGYLERYYNVSFEYIEASNLTNMTCDGKLYLSESFDNVMRSIEILSNIEYSKENNSIYIHNK